MVTFLQNITKIAQRARGFALAMFPTVQFLEKILSFDSSPPPFSKILVTYLPRTLLLILHFTVPLSQYKSLLSTISDDVIASDLTFAHP